MNLLKKIFDAIKKSVPRFFLPAYAFGLWHLLCGIGCIVVAFAINAKEWTFIVFVVGAAFILYGLDKTICAIVKKAIRSFKEKRNPPSEGRFGGDED